MTSTSPYWDSELSPPEASRDLENIENNNSLMHFCFVLCLLAEKCVRNTSGLGQVSCVLTEESKSKGNNISCALSKCVKNKSFN